MRRVEKSTLAAGSGRVGVGGRNFEQSKALRAIGLIVAHREILGADTGYDSMTSRVAHRARTVYRTLHSRPTWASDPRFSRIVDWDHFRQTKISRYSGVLSE